MDPRISIGIDNCFAIKRWTEPDEWARVIKDMGAKYIECVTDIDNEPFLMPEEYMRDWTNRVNEAQVKHGVDVVLVYSNNSTYDTTGLAHPDPGVRRHIVDNWFGRTLRNAKEIGAGLGYFVHAFPEKIMYDKNKFDEAYVNMLNSCVEVNRIAADVGVERVAFEQMYTPHQSPFTISKTLDLLLHVNRESGHPLYVTEDVGHHCSLYLRPTEEKLRAAYERYKKDSFVDIWLGSKSACTLFTESCGDTLPVNTVRAIMEDVEQNGHLFSEPQDNDCYCWIRELGAYSPVIHMQQTDGGRSAHADFTEENNKTGIIHPVRILRALHDSYLKDEIPGMPPRAEDIYLILELYIKTAEIGYQGLYRMARSIDYLRRFIPRDDMPLSELLELNKDVVC